MAETTSFRSSINGFNREDVVSYISSVLDKLTSVEKSNAEMQAELEKKSFNCDELMQERIVLSQELSEAKERNSALEQTQAELTERCAALEVRCEELEKACKVNESKLGAAMLEAKRFSEMLVKEANDRAGEVYHEAYESVCVSSANAKEIDAKMKELSVEFDQAMGEMRRNMKKLIAGMKAFSENARDNGAKFLYQSEFSEEAE
ncbi:MAG: hypothetical protein IJK89_05330 [Clostridia bacterium]|nr:hypothetical protein [Clostridia bacterium]